MFIQNNNKLIKRRGIGVEYTCLSRNRLRISLFGDLFSLVGDSMLANEKTDSFSKLVFAVVLVMYTVSIPSKRNL